MRSCSACESPYPARIKSVRVPLLVIHGKADDIVPISQGKMVFDAANEPRHSGRSTAPHIMILLSGPGRNASCNWGGSIDQSPAMTHNRVYWPQQRERGDCLCELSPLEATAMQPS